MIKIIKYLIYNSYKRVFFEDLLAFSTLFLSLFFAAISFAYSRFTYDINTSLIVAKDAVMITFILTICSYYLLSIIIELIIAIKNLLSEYNDMYLLAKQSKLKIYGAHVITFGLIFLEKTIILLGLLVFIGFINNSTIEKQDEYFLLSEILPVILNALAFIFAFLMTFLLLQQIYNLKYFANFSTRGKITMLNGLFLIIAVFCLSLITIFSESIISDVGQYIGLIWIYVGLLFICNTILYPLQKK